MQKKKPIKKTGKYMISKFDEGYTEDNANILEAFKDDPIKLKQIANAAPYGNIAPGEFIKRVQSGNKKELLRIVKRITGEIDDIILMEDKDEN